MFITGTWSFQPLKKVLTFMATAIEGKFPKSWDSKNKNPNL